MVNTNDAKQLRKNINIRGKLENFSEIRSVNLKDGRTINVRDVNLTDEAGFVKLTLWGDDCEKFNAGDEVELANGYSNEFKGTISLAKGKFGTLEKV
jgi:replication factor A1